jgi:hypothetical protein
MNMKRSIDRWKICNPSAIITDQSEAAIGDKAAIAKAEGEQA